MAAVQSYAMHDPLPGCSGCGAAVTRTAGTAASRRFSHRAGGAFRLSSSRTPVRTSCQRERLEMTGPQ